MYWESEGWVIYPYSDKLTFGSTSSLHNPGMAPGLVREEEFCTRRKERGKGENVLDSSGARGRDGGR